MLPVINIASRTLRQAGEYLQQSIDRQEFLLEDASNIKDRIAHIEKSMHKTVLQQLKRSYNDHYVADLGETNLETKEVAWKFIPIQNPVSVVRGLPFSTMSLVCLHRGKAEHALIFNISTGEEYTASRGHGATLNGKRIRTGKVTNLGNALLAANVLDFSAGSATAHVYTDLYTELNQTGFPPINSGNPSLDIIYTAAGKVDGTVLLNTKIEDLEAALLIAKESGALQADLSGNNLTESTRSIITANPKLFKAILQKLYTYRSRLV